MRILVVDDEEYIRDMLGDALRARRYETGFAADGDEALVALRATRYDVVLTDVRMPGLDALELVKRIRREHPGVRIVVLTGYSREADIGDFMLQGADEFLPKPFRANDVVAVLKRLERGLSTGGAPTTPQGEGGAP